ncbi:hypothetical protein WOLCODRAFT_167727 [Wolfiporia cocos MD-104 SS10]|uniref:Uncharacterized protein n=1 Tax=Wolfiporia cocos (strain MD-104) TaxID=742152 RepID=A0A2H3JQM4_WOLCO|nr:hypothetical protein WOLCODRAFT_167727 [Wolfiporia cocos MD-104 SS10]
MPDPDGILPPALSQRRHPTPSDALGLKEAGTLYRSEARLGASARTSDPELTTTAAVDAKLARLSSSSALQSQADAMRRSAWCPGGPRGYPPPQCQANLIASVISAVLVRAVPDAVPSNGNAGSGYGPALNTTIAKRG